MQMACLSYRKGPFVCLRLSVRLSVRHTCDSSKRTQARITKYSLSSPQKTLLPGSLKCFKKFELGDPDRGNEMRGVGKVCDSTNKSPHLRCSAR